MTVMNSLRPDEDAEAGKGSASNVGTSDVGLLSGGTWVSGGFRVIGGCC